MGLGEITTCTATEPPFPLPLLRRSFEKSDKRGDLHTLWPIVASTRCISQFNMLHLLHAWRAVSLKK